MLSPSQIQKLLNQYLVADYEQPINGEIMKAVASRVTEKSDVLLLTAVDMEDSGPYEIAEPRRITALETYTPSCKCRCLPRTGQPLMFFVQQGSKLRVSSVSPRSSLRRPSRSRRSSRWMPRPTATRISAWRWDRRSTARSRKSRRLMRCKKPVRRTTPFHHPFCIFLSVGFADRTISSLFLDLFMTGGYLPRVLDRGVASPLTLPFRAHVRQSRRREVVCM